jgi:hypothetical protein
MEAFLQKVVALGICVWWIYFAVFLVILTILMALSLVGFVMLVFEVLHLSPIILAWLALGVGGFVVVSGLIGAAKDEAAPRVPTAEEKLAADQARFNEWCKSRGL